MAERSQRCDFGNDHRRDDPFKAAQPVPPSGMPVSGGLL